MTDSKNSHQDNLSDYPKCGYVVDGIESVMARFKCIFCFLIMREPIQLTQCGHRSCRGCFENRAAVLPDGNVECPCEDCHEITNKNEIMPDRAFKRELDVLQVKCQYPNDRECRWIGSLKDYQIHLDENHIHYICSACKERFSSKATLDEHETKTCPEIFQLCPLAPFCSEEMIRRTEFSTHLQSEKHQETITKLFKGEYVFTTPSNHEQEMEINARNQQLEEQTTQKILDLSDKVRQVDSNTVKLNDTFTNITKSVNVTGQDLNIIHVAINERLPIKQSLQPNQEKLQKDIEKLQQACQENENISTDGTLTWRIDRVSEKMSDAQSERQTSIYSPIFHSSPTGYKMRARLFLFGDGNARRTHMSLFFLLMKGEYDAILKWPFHYKVTFCLLDQTGGDRHIIDSFHPDVKSNSFQRPKDAVNVASGIPKFFPLPMLLQDDNAYVREDTLYIKIIITLNETPKTMLPFLLTLNPALPTYVQENLVNQEIIKRQQSSAAGSSQTTLTSAKNEYRQWKKEVQNLPVKRSSLREPKFFLKRFVTKKTTEHISTQVYSENFYRNNKSPRPRLPIYR